MQDFTLNFGKFKGQKFLSTPTSYQDWLLKQDWFKGAKKTEATNEEVLYLHTRVDYNNCSFENWLKQVKVAYENYFKRNKADIGRYGEPMEYDEWIYKQLLAVVYGQ